VHFDFDPIQVEEFLIGPVLLVLLQDRGDHGVDVVSNSFEHEGGSLFDGDFEPLDLVVVHAFDFERTFETFLDPRDSLHLWVDAERLTR